MTTPRRAAGRGPDASTVRGRHIPVHLPEALEPSDGATFIDSTLGLADVLGFH